MSVEKHRVLKGVDEAAAKLNEKLSDEVAKTFTLAFEAGVPPKNALGINDSRIEELYAQGYRYYNTGRFGDALNNFRMLTFFDPTQAKFVFGLAACLHMLKEYDKAVETYLLSSMMDPKNPIPHFHSSDCYLKMNDKPSALIALRMAVECAQDKPEFQILKDRALLSIEGLRNEIVNDLKSEADKSL